LAVPILVAGKVIGVLDTYKPRDAGPWTEDEIGTLESLVAQLGMSLESARLYEETQRRAAREELVGDIAARLRASMDPDAILKTTVRELGQALGAELASVEIGISSDDGGPYAATATPSSRPGPMRTGAARDGSRGAVFTVQEGE
jgi:GAF domain-containing protein